MSAEKHTCVGRVWNGWSHHTCGRGAKYERDGGWYCGTHDPVARREKHEAKNAKLNAEWNARRKANAEADAKAAEQKRRADCYPDLLAALQTAARYAYNEGNDEEIAQVADAIAKATGGITI